MDEREFVTRLTRGFAQLSERAPAGPTTESVRGALRRRALRRFGVAFCALLGAASALHMLSASLPLGSSEKGAHPVPTTPPGMVRAAHPSTGLRSPAPAEPSEGGLAPRENPLETIERFVAEHAIRSMRVTKDGGGRHSVLVAFSTRRAAQPLPEEIHALLASYDAVDLQVEDGRIRCAVVKRTARSAREPR